LPNDADINLFRPYEEGNIREYYKLNAIVRAIIRLDDALRSKIG
jgi:hypothetical protein